LFIIYKKRFLMINEQECIKILNGGEYKFTHDEMLQIREFLTTLAIIEFEGYKKKHNKSSSNECDLLQESKH
jgi:hypothetical protein